MSAESSVIDTTCLDETTKIVQLSPGTLQENHRNRGGTGSSAGEKRLEVVKDLSQTPQTPVIASFDGSLERYKFDSSPNLDPLMHTIRTPKKHQQQKETPTSNRKSDSSSVTVEAPTTMELRPTSSRLPTTTATVVEQEHSPGSTNTRKRASTVSQSSPAKKVKRHSSGYAPPSKYAHLVNKLTDSLAPNLICVFVGLNPGIRTATTGHAYNHPSNLFWRLLHKSGCTPRLCRAEEDGDMPRLYDLGLTNIVSRPTKDGSELSKSEMDSGVAELEAKIVLQKPEVVAIVGKSIWESLWRVRHGTNIKKEQFKYGWQDDSERMGVVNVGEDQWSGARVFVATTTSGLAAGMRPHEKEEIWRKLGEWVEQRRQQRMEDKERPTSGASGTEPSRL
ncbi:MAG: hypothetical protein L6R39_005347 [Caloplaca ligustica]|nr:MAG: hypothetical protein L6R39_005347 [Caloplaca ligustica]